MLHLPGNVDDLVESDISVVFNVLLLLPVSWWLLEGFDDQGRGRGHHLNLGLSVLDGQFHCNPQAFPVTGCLGNIITNFFSETDPGGRSWGPRQMWHPPHLRCTSGTRL